MKKKILIVILFILVGIQFIRPEENNGQAETSQDITHAVQVPEPVMRILKSSCFDCHSNHTDYPWYFRVNPVGLWLGKHIRDAKSELNFSEFSTYDLKKKDHKLEEIAEEVKEGHMPLPAYTLIHTDAKLSDEQIKVLENWIIAERKKLVAEK